MTFVTIWSKKDILSFWQTTALMVVTTRMMTLMAAFLPLLLLKLPHLVRKRQVECGSLHQERQILIPYRNSIPWYNPTINFCQRHHHHRCGNRVSWQHRLVCLSQSIEAQKWIYFVHSKIKWPPIQHFMNKLYISTMCISSHHMPCVHFNIEIVFIVIENIHDIWINIIVISIVLLIILFWTIYFIFSDQVVDKGCHQWVWLG